MSLDSEAVVHPVRWGLLGTGTICRTFAQALAAVPGSTLQAVGSRAQTKAQDFARQFGAVRSWGSYEALVADPEVDAVYIGTPHPWHAEHTRLALSAGKSVLCEKPFALNAEEAERMVAQARAQGLFLMEAMWTRFLPITAQVQRWINEGRIGDLRVLRADFGFRTPWNPTSRWLAPELGGGALLNVGVYPVSYSALLLGHKPTTVQSCVNLGSTGVDEQALILFHYPSGAMAQLGCAVRTRLTQQAELLGTEGKIVVPNFFRAEELVWTSSSGQTETISFPHAVNGFEYQIREVARCLSLGLMESPILPLDESLAVMRLLDQIRAPWCLRDPAE